MHPGGSGPCCCGKPGRGTGLCGFCSLRIEETFTAFSGKDIENPTEGGKIHLVEHYWRPRGVCQAETEAQKATTRNVRSSL